MRRRPQPLSTTAHAVLRVLKSLGRPISAHELRASIGCSWVRLADAVGVLQQRHLVRVSNRMVMLTRDGAQRAT